jgi:hypothetical protein
MKHTPCGTPNLGVGFCLSSATRLSEFLTRGFASQSHGWFALIEEVPLIKIVCIGLGSKVGANRHEMGFPVCFGQN